MKSPVDFYNYLLDNKISCSLYPIEDDFGKVAAYEITVPFKGLGKALKSYIQKNFKVTAICGGFHAMLWLEEE